MLTLQAAVLTSREPNRWYNFSVLLFQLLAFFLVRLAALEAAPCRLSIPPLERPSWSVVCVLHVPFKQHPVDVKRAGFLMSICVLTLSTPVGAVKPSGRAKRAFSPSDGGAQSKPLKALLFGSCADACKAAQTALSSTSSGAFAQQN